MNRDKVIDLLIDYAKSIMELEALCPLEDSNQTLEDLHEEFDLINQAIDDVKKMEEIEHLLNAAEVPGGLLLAIRKIVFPDDNFD